MLETSARTIVGSTMLLVLTRVISKKQLGQMNIFTYITGIAIGNMAGEMMIHSNVRITDSVAGLVLWCFLAIVT